MPLRSSYTKKTHASSLQYPESHLGADRGGGTLASKWAQFEGQGAAHMNLLHGEGVRKLQ